MGRLFAFECERCGYRARVSGGADRAAVCFIQTVSCARCRELVDVATHVRLPRAKPPRLPKIAAQRRAAAPAWDEALASVVLPDHVHSSRVLADPFPSMIDRLLPGTSARNWIALAKRCPADPSHIIQDWNHPGPCPRCGAFMNRMSAPLLDFDH
jgi:hypothetical protein